MTLLPGYLPPGAAGVGGVTITQVASATSTANTIVAPANIIAGDILVLLDRAISTITSPTAVVPTGFTSISNLTGSVPSAFGSQRQIASFKLAVGTEGGGTITGMDGNVSDSKVLVVFRPSIPAILLTLLGVGGQSIATDPTAQVVPSSAGAPPLIVLGFYGVSAGTIDPCIMTPDKDGEVAQGTVNYIAWKIFNTSPLNVSVDMDDEDTDAGGNILQSCFIQVG